MLSTRMVMPTDLWTGMTFHSRGSESWNRPSQRLNRTSAAITQWKAIAPRL